MLIGFTGKAGAGKNTACDYLRRKDWIKPGIRLGFADALKLGVATMFSFDVSLLEDRDFKEAELPGLGFSPRKALQVIATEAVRNHLGQDTWIKLLEKEYAHFKTRVDDIFISDMRFDNEAEWVIKNGGYVVSIIQDKFRPGNDSDHVSESGISDNLITCTVINRHSKDKKLFYIELDNLYDYLKSVKASEI